MYTALIHPQLLILTFITWVVPNIPTYNRTQWSSDYIWMAHLKICFPLHYFWWRQCIIDDQQRLCLVNSWTRDQVAMEWEGKTAGLIIRGRQFPALWGAQEDCVFLACCMRLKRRQILYSTHRGPVDPWAWSTGGSLIASSFFLPTIKQGRRMNRVDIQIVPDDEGYREVRNLFRNFVWFLNGFFIKYLL